MTVLQLEKAGKVGPTFSEVFGEANRSWRVEIWLMVKPMDCRVESLEEKKLKKLVLGLPRAMQEVADEVCQESSRESSGLTAQ